MIYIYIYIIYILYIVIECFILNDPPEYFGNEIRYEFRSCGNLFGFERDRSIITSFL